jgi:hypothetical protein
MRFELPLTERRHGSQISLSPSCRSIKYTSFVDPLLQLPDLQRYCLNCFLQPSSVLELQHQQSPVEKAPESITPPSSHPLFDSYRQREVKTRTVRKMIQNGRQTGLGKVCLGWHTKGMCNSDCGLKYDHIQYTQDELQPLCTWCGTNYPDEATGSE